MEARIDEENTILEHSFDKYRVLLFKLPPSYSPENISTLFIITTVKNFILVIFLCIVWIRFIFFVVKCCTKFCYLIWTNIVWRETFLSNPYLTRWYHWKKTPFLLMAEKQSDTFEQNQRHNISVLKWYIYIYHSKSQSICSKHILKNSILVLKTFIYSWMIQENFLFHLYY